MRIVLQPLHREGHAGASGFGMHLRLMRIGRCQGRRLVTPQNQALLNPVLAEVRRVKNNAAPRGRVLPGTWVVISKARMPPIAPAH